MACALLRTQMRARKHFCHERCIDNSAYVVQQCCFKHCCATSMEDCMNNRGLHRASFVGLLFPALHRKLGVVYWNSTFFEAHVHFPLHRQDSPICWRGQATFAKQWASQLEHSQFVGLLRQEFGGGLCLQGWVQMPRSLEILGFVVLQGQSL